MSEWHIIKGANDILICGPGNLIISLREFDRKKVEMIDKDVMGKATLVSRVRYPLDNKISLELTLLSSGSHTQIKLHVGDRIQWTIPEDFANALKNILTAAPVYSQPNVKKSTGTLKVKAKRKGPAKPKHQKISGRALELQKNKVELPVKTEKELKKNKKTKNTTVSATVTTKGKPGRPPKKANAAPQGVLVDNVTPSKSPKPVGRPPKKAKPVAQAILVNNVVMPKPSKPVGRPPKSAKPASAKPAAAKPTTAKPADKKGVAKTTAKVVKAKPQSKSKKAK